MKPATSEQSVFAEALLCDSPETRATYLDAACGTDAALRRRVEALLSAAEKAGDFLEEPPTGLGPNKTLVISFPPTEKAGDKIGRYKLLQQIGEGGCGVVYMAEQEEPVRRRVALKVIKLGMDTKNVIARFEAERQALAMMDHPNIAKVLDAGATEAGRPYFVMELVRGIKITEYCDQNNLSTAERLKLFTQVCHAIQHAHQKGIIHRDIKPSNILVTMHDGVPVPKVIDFGIAKATQGRLTDQTLFTAFEQFIGTPAYMSPEQAEMTGLDIDTRSDIYSLGVLLYELLTGKTPFDATELMAAGIDAMRRTIREQEPARPSTALSTMLNADISNVAKHRNADAPKLIHLLSGDLDWVVMKCLEKDRTRRYDTANGLAMDLQRHLSNEPVVARPPSNLYRFQKLVRRNKFAFAAVAAVTMALVLGVVVSSWQALRATRAEQAQIKLREVAEAEKKKAQTESAKSEQVAQFLKDMLKGVGPSVAVGRDTTMLREILDKTARRLKELKDQPAVEADLRATLGSVYFDLGEYTNAAGMHREAMNFQKRLLGDEHPDVAASLNNLAVVLWRQGQPAEAEKTYRDALAMRRKLLGNEHLDVAQTLIDFSFLLREKKAFSEAETNVREVLAIYKKGFGAEHPSVAYALHLLAWNLNLQGKASEAEALSREEVAMRRKVQGNEQPDVMSALCDLAIYLRDQGKRTEAEAVASEALALREKVLVLNEANPEMAEYIHHLAWLLHDLGKPAEAEVVYREELALRRKVLGNEHPKVAATLHTLAAILRDHGKLFEAEGYAREALALQKKLFGQENAEVAQSLYLLAGNLNSQGKQTEAEALFREALAAFAQLARKDPKIEIQPELLGHTHWKLGQLLTDTGRHEEAGQAFREALRIFEKAAHDFPAERFFRQEQAFSHRYLASLAKKLEQFADAEKHYQAAIDLYAALAAEAPQTVLYSREMDFTISALARMGQEQGKPADLPSPSRAVPPKPANP